MNLQPNVVAWLAVAACGLTVLLTGVVIVQALRLRRLSRRYTKAFANGEHEVVGVLAAFAQRLERIESHGRTQDEATRRLSDTLGYAVSHATVTRYDAFSDMGGEQSFSFALLDAHSTGVVLTAINGRSDTRVYAKPVRNGVSTAVLSGEEEAAIAAAKRQYDVTNKEVAS